MAEPPPSKPALRQMFLERRALLAPEARRESAAKVYELFFEHVSVPEGAVVAGYWPIRNELDDRPILRELLRRNCRCALPHVAGEAAPLEFHLWNEATPMAVGKYGIMEPAAAPAVVPDIVLVPLAAFDANCHRLGYGGGFYDATIARLKQNKPLLAIGLAYEMQLCAGLLAEEGDIRMDMIVSDRNIYK